MGGGGEGGACQCEAMGPLRGEREGHVGGSAKGQGGEGGCEAHAWHKRSSAPATHEH